MKKLINGGCPRPPINKYRWIFILLSIGLLIASFFYPAFYIDRKDFDAWSSSIGLFFFGGYSILADGIKEWFIWLANPLYVTAMILFMRNKRKYLSLGFSFIAVLLAWSFSQLSEILTSESGATSKITSLETGYYLWLISIATLFIGIIISLLVFKRSDANKE